MELFKKLLFTLCIVLGISGCAIKRDVQMNFPQEIASVYLKTQKGTDGSIERIMLYIALQKDLKENVQLEKIYFRTQEATFEKVNAKLYRATISPVQIDSNLILSGEHKNEYGNVAPEIRKSKFELLPNDAMLQYKLSNKTLYYKITNIKEQ